MISIPSLTSYIPSPFKPRTTHYVSLSPVKVYDVELEKSKNGRALKHLIKLNHANNAILFHNLQFHNHVPHILGSAFILKAEAAHLEETYEKESSSLDRWQDSPGEVSQHDWREYLSKREYQRAFVDFFEDQLVENGYDWRKVVEEYLFRGKEPLINNVIAGAAHPLIHLGYAIELNSKEIAMEALGLAATNYNFLHKYLDDAAYTQPGSYSRTSPLELLEQVRADARFDGIFDSPGSGSTQELFDKREAAVLEWWNAWELAEPTQQFRDSQRAAAAILSATGSFDFLFVHTLTSSHAARIVLPWLPREHHVSLVRQWWLFVLSVYIVQGRPKIDMDSLRRYDTAGRDWAWAEKRAIQSKWSHDPHYVKAIRALKEAANTWGDSDQFYLKAALNFADNFDGWFVLAAESSVY